MINTVQKSKILKERKMQNNTDETKHEEIKDVVDIRKPCCCQTQEHIPGDETPHYCCQEESLWTKIKRIFS